MVFDVHHHTDIEICHNTLLQEVQKASNDYWRKHICQFWSIPRGQSEGDIKKIGQVDDDSISLFIHHINSNLLVNNNLKITRTHSQKYIDQK